MRGVLVAVLAAGLAVAVVGTAILASAASLLGVGGGTPSASSAATAKIPAAMLTLYQQAAETCPGLPWTILAAIGTIESDNASRTCRESTAVQMLPERKGLSSSSRRHSPSVI